MKSVQELVSHEIEKGIEKSKQAMKKVTERMDTAHAFLQETGWFEDRIRDVAYGALCESVQAIAEKYAMVDAIEAIADSETIALMRNQYRGSSSSAYHNAVEGSKREAASMFVADARSWLRRIAEEEQKSSKK